MANQTCTASGFEFFGTSRIINLYGDLLAVLSHLPFHNSNLVK